MPTSESDGTTARGAARRRGGLSRVMVSVAALVAATGAAHGAEPVVAGGVSHLDASFGRVKVQVDLEARDHAVATLGVRVDGYALPVPPAAFSDVVDPASFDVARRDDGLMELRIVGGGAGAETSSVIVFDRLGVRERRTVDVATGAVKQSTAFSAPDLLD